MDGICPSSASAPLRINSDIVTWPQTGGNARRVKVPAAPNQRYVGLVLLFSVDNGEPLAIMPDGVMRGCASAPPTGSASSISRGKTRAVSGFSAPAGKRARS